MLIVLGVDAQLVVLNLGAVPNVGDTVVNVQNKKEYFIESRCLFTINTSESREPVAFCSAVERSGERAPNYPKILKACLNSHSF